MRYLYIAGKWTEAADDGTSQTINPYDASVLDTLAEACTADVDAAVIGRPGGLRRAVAPLHGDRPDRAARQDRRPAAAGP